MTTDVSPPPRVTDEQALWAAIEADPSDDAAKLVAADWFEEHNQLDLAAGLRWCGRRSKRPHASSQGGFVFFRDEDTGARADELSYVSAALFSAMPGESIPYDRPLAHKQYPSLRAAFAAVGAAAEGGGG